MSVKLAQYNHKVAIDVNGHEYSGYLNETTRKFYENRFVVIRNIIPKDLLQFVNDTWKVIEQHPASNEFYFGDPEEETTFDTPDAQKFSSHGAYCFPPAVALHHFLVKELRNHLTIALKETYSYTRKYKRNAVLNAHYDRPSCEISVTTVMDYKTDDNTPWTIWVQNDINYLGEDQSWAKSISQDEPVRRRKNAIPIRLEPGDILVYQGPNVVHWRDTLVGDYSKHIFLHFYNEHSRLKGWPECSINVQVDGFPDRDYGNQYATVLDYDGRQNRYTTYDEDIENTEKKLKFRHFMERWDEVCGRSQSGDEEAKNFLQQTCNYYDNIEFKDKKIENDSIQQEKD